MHQSNVSTTLIRSPTRLKMLLKLPKYTASVLLNHTRRRSSWMDSLKSLIAGNSNNNNIPQIRQVGDPVLRQKAQPVDPLAIHTEEFKELLQMMIRTMRAKKAVGIAAPQIGVSLQVFAMEFTKEAMNLLKKNGATLDDLRQKQMDVVPLRIFINPEIKITNPKMVVFREGCLSLEGFSGLVPRALEVEVSGLDENGAPITWQASGWAARIAQHEVDHLRGNIFIDSMTYKSFMNVNWRDYID